jgi:hypothetical protein
MNEGHNKSNTKITSSYSDPSHVFSALASPSHPKVSEIYDTARLFRPVRRQDRRPKGPYTSSEVIRGHHELLVASPVTRVVRTSPPALVTDRFRRLVPKKCHLARGVSMERGSAVQRLTPIKAIRKKCWNCSGGQVKEIRLCPIPSSALWPYRMERRPGIMPKQASQILRVRRKSRPNL